MIRKVLQLWSDLHRKSGARIAVGAAVGVMGLVLGAMLQSTALFSQPAADDPRLLIASAKRSQHAGQAKVGHLLYKVTAARLQSVPNPQDKDAPRVVARISVRITDIQGIADYIDNKTFHLLIDDECLTHENNVNLTVGENASTQAELLFTLPEEVATAELLVGRAKEGAVRIPLELIPRRMADGS